MASQDYRELKKTVATLRKHLLPRKFDPTGDYVDRTFTGVVSFRVLCHAAIEEYLESRVIDIATRCSIAAGSGVITHSMACMLSFSPTHFGPPPDTLVPAQVSQKKSWPEKLDIQERAKAISASYIAYAAKDNHGIRERNLLRLLIPIGFKISAIDSVLVTELDSFGQLRGLFAHSSAAKHIKSKPDPKDELERVSKIIELLLGVDQELDRLRKLIPAK